jgi:hypothetical protein
MPLPVSHDVFLSRQIFDTSPSVAVFCRSRKSLEK